MWVLPTIKHEEENYVSKDNMKQTEQQIVHDIIEDKKACSCKDKKIYYVLSMNIWR